MASPHIGILNGPYDALHPVGRLNTYFTYLSSSMNNTQIITIADFSQVLDAFSQPDTQPETFFERLLAWFAAPTSAVGQRTSKVEIPRDSQHAMHPDQPLLAYNDHGTIQIKHLYNKDIITVDQASATPFPLIWINHDTLEYFDPNGYKVCWTLSTRSVLRGTRPARPEPDVPSARAVVSMISAETKWALVLDVPSEPSSEPWEPDLYLYSVVNHQYKKLARPNECRLHATLLAFQNSTYVVTTHDAPNSTYEIRLWEPLGDKPISISTPSKRPGESVKQQRLLSVETFGAWGLISLVFEEETHIYAVTSELRIYRIATTSEGVDRVAEAGLVGRIINDCQKLERGKVIVLKEQLLTFTGHRAVALSNFLQRYLESMPRDDDKRSTVLTLLQDICTLSGQLPTSYWLAGNLDIGRWFESGGQAIISDATHSTTEGKVRAVVVREMKAPGDVTDTSKWYTKDGLRILRMIHREIIIQWQLNHPNIIPLDGVYRDFRYPAYMVYPKLRSGVISTLERNPAKFLPITKGIVKGLQYLHVQRPPIIHGDLKPDNILLSDDGGRPILCDFGLSRIRHEITRTKTLFHPGLSARYAAPELPNLHDASFRTTEAADIYSLSMTIFHLGTLEQPYNHIGEDAGVRAAAQAGKRPEPPRESSNLNRELWGMLGGMWAHKPNKRLTIDQVAVTLGLPTHHA